MMKKRINNDAQSSYSGDYNALATEGRQLAKKKKRIVVTVISIVICIAVVLSAIFAIYTATGGFKTGEIDGDNIFIQKDADGITRLAVVKLDGKDTPTQIDVSVLLKPFLISYDIKIADESVVKIQGGKLLAVAPGKTIATVYSQDGAEVAKIDLEVLDAKGRLSYNVDFVDIENKLVATYSVISGKTMAETLLKLPLLPQRLGYKSIGWTYGNQSFFASQKITSDITVKPSYTAIDVDFNGETLSKARYREYVSYDLTPYAYEGSGHYSFAGAKVPSGLSVTADGLLVGTPTQAGTFDFDVTVTDKINGDTKTTSFSITILPRVASIAFGSFELVYNGNQQHILAEVSNIAPEDIGLVSTKIQYKNSGLITPYVTNANSYIAEVIGLTGSKSANYILPDNAYTKNFSVAPREAEILFYSHNVNAADFNLVYNGKVQGLFAKVNNLVGDDVCEIILAYDGENKNAKRGYVATVEASDVLSNPNYKLSTSASQKYNIIKAPLTIMLQEGQTKIYGDNDPEFAFSVSGVQSSADNISEKDAIAAQILPCISRVTGETVGLYTISLGNLPIDSEVLSNYDVSVIGTQSKLAITPRPISIVGDAITKVYDGTDQVDNNGLQLEPFNFIDSTGMVNGDMLTFSGKYTEEGGIAKNVTNKRAVIFTLGGKRAGNYTLVGEYFGSITRKIITVMNLGNITAKDKNYDATLNVEIVTSGATIINALTSDDIYVGGCEGRYNDANVGSGKPITITKVILEGKDSANYQVQYGGQTDLKGNILPKQVTVGGVHSKTYDGNTALAISSSNIIGALNDEAVEVVGAYASANAGLQTIIFKLSDTAINKNYVLVGNYSGTIKKLQAAIGGTFSKPYDANNLVNSAQISIVNKVEGDSISIFGYYNNANVGSGKAITFQLGADDVSSNYSVDGVTAKGAITQKEITEISNIVATVPHIYNGSAVYDNKNISIANAVFKGMLSGDTLSFRFASASFADANVGNGKYIVLSGIELTGASATDYAFSSSITVTAIGQIIPREITIIGDYNKTYDTNADVTNTIKYTNGVVNDALDISGTYSNASVGNDKDITFVLAAGGANNNYSIANASYNGNIVPKAITAISGITSDGKTYDGTISLAVANTNTGAVIFEGAYQGAKIAINFASAGTFADANVGIAKVATFTSFNLVGEDSANYYIAPASIQINADIRHQNITVGGTISKTYDGTNEVINTLNIQESTPDVLTVSGIYSGDGATNVGVGKAVIIKITGDNIDNYIIKGTYTGAITPKQITAITGITVSNKQYDKTMNVGANQIDVSNAVYKGILDNEKLSFSYTSAEYNSEKVLDANKVTIKGVTLKNGEDGTLATNYSIKSDAVEVASTITAKQLTLSTEDNIITKIYDGTKVVTTQFELWGKENGDDVVVNLEYSQFIAGENIVVKTSISGADKANYGISSYIGNIVIKNIAVDIQQKEYVYNGSEQNVIYNGKLEGIATTDYIEYKITTKGYNVATYSFAENNNNLNKEVKITNDGIDVTSSYSIKFVGTVKIIPIEVTVISTGTYEKTYDGTTQVVASLSTSNVLLGDKVVVIGTAELESSAVNSQAKASVALSLEGSDSHNYVLASNSIEIVVKIVAAKITIQGNLDKIYDNDDNVNINNLRINGMIGNDVLTLNGVYADKGAGEHSIQFTLGGEAANNYTVENIYKGIIAPFVLTATGDINKKYDGKVGVDIAGLSINKLELTDVAIELAQYDTRSVGDGKTVKFTLTGSDKDNYTIKDRTDGKIAKLAVEVDLGNRTKVYDGDYLYVDLSTLNAQVADGETLNGNRKSTTKYCTPEPVGFQEGNVDVTITDADGNSTIANYNISYKGTAKITKKSITVTVTGENKIYDGSTIATVKITFNDGVIIPGDEVYVASYEASFIDATIGENKKVTVTVVKITGERASNYDLVIADYTTSAHIHAKIS